MVIGDDHELKQQFLEDVKTMAYRIKSMRTKLLNALIANKCPGDWSHITSAIGMFTYTGLSNKQVLYLKEKFAVYLVAQRGRMCMCGLTDMNVQYVADALKDAVLNVK